MLSSVYQGSIFLATWVYFSTSFHMTQTRSHSARFSFCLAISVMYERVRSCAHSRGASHFTVKSGKRNVCIVNMPVCPVQVVGGAWLFSRLYCNIFVTLDVMMCTASILNLCAISIDR